MSPIRFTENDLKRCLFCGETFDSSRQPGLYCSFKCRKWAIKEALLKRQQPLGWIDIKRTAPPEDRAFLLVTKDEEGKRSVDIGCVCPRFASDDSRGASYILATWVLGMEVWRFREVTHWAPLPEMPEEVKE